MQIKIIREPVYLTYTYSCRALNMLNASNFNKPFISDGNYFSAALHTGVSANNSFTITNYHSRYTSDILDFYFSEPIKYGNMDGIQYQEKNFVSSLTSTALPYGDGGGGILGGLTTHVSGVGNVGGPCISTISNVPNEDPDSWVNFSIFPYKVSNVSTPFLGLIRNTSRYVQGIWISRIGELVNLGISGSNAAFSLTSLCGTYDLVNMTASDYTGWSNSSTPGTNSLYTKTYALTVPDVSGVTTRVAYNKATISYPGANDVMYDTCCDEQYLYTVARKLPNASGIVLYRTDVRISGTIAAANYTSYGNIYTVGNPLTSSASIKDVAIALDGGRNLLCMWSETPVFNADSELLYPTETRYKISNDQGATWPYSGNIDDNRIGVVANPYNDLVQHWDKVAQDASIKTNIIGLKNGGWAVSTIQDIAISGIGDPYGQFNRIGRPVIYLITPSGKQLQEFEPGLFGTYKSEIYTYASGLYAAGYNRRNEIGIRSCIGAAWMQSPTIDRVYDDRLPLKLLVQHGKQGLRYMEQSRHGDSNIFYDIDMIDILLDSNNIYVEPSGIQIPDPSGNPQPSGIIV